MQTYNTLSRKEYMETVHSNLKDSKDIKFSKVAIGMWDLS